MMNALQDMKETPSNRRRRFRTMFGVCCSLSAVVMALPGTLLPHVPKAGVFPYFFAAVVTLPIIGAFVVTGAYVSGEKDDFLRMCSGSSTALGNRRDFRGRHCVGVVEALMAYICHLCLQTHGLSS